MGRAVQLVSQLTDYIKVDSWLKHKVGELNQCLGTADLEHKLATCSSIIFLNYWLSKWTHAWNMQFS